MILPRKNALFLGHGKTCTARRSLCMVSCKTFSQKLRPEKLIKTERVCFLTEVIPMKKVGRTIQRKGQTLVNHEREFDHERVQNNEHAQLGRYGAENKRERFLYGGKGVASGQKDRSSRTTFFSSI
jgi:hypothetical protein